MSIFDKLNKAADLVLKGQMSAPESKEMTLNEFANFAADEIAKANDEREEKPALATARLKSLAVSCAVAQAAFEKSGLEKFEIPVFGANAEMDISVMAKLDEIMEATKAKPDFSKPNPFGDKDKKKDKADKEAEAKAKSDKADADAAAEVEAKAKADADEATKAAEVAAKAKTDADAVAKAAADADADADDTKDVWPDDMAKSMAASDEVRELYEWGDDPEAVSANVGRN